MSPKWGSFTLSRGTSMQQELKRGDEVIDIWGSKGIVVKIVKPENPTVEDHGMIFVWQSERTDYGADNCEHYVYHDWEKVLRIVG